MRKGMAVMLSAALAGCLWGCNGEGENAEEVSLYAQGMDVIRLMQEMSQSEEYAGFISGSPELQDKILEMGQGDYIAPKMVYQIWPDGDSILSAAGIGSQEERSEELRIFLNKRVIGAVPSQLNGMSGVESLAAANACTAGKTFQNSAASEDVIYLYTFEDAAPAAVTFIAGEDDTVEATGMFVLLEELPLDSAEELQSFLSNIGIKAEVAEVNES